MEFKEQLAKGLQGRDCLCLTQFSKEELFYIMDLAADIKEKSKKGEPYDVLKGKTLGMIFHKPSTRTRVSFEVGTVQLGGYALFLSANELQLGRGETIGDTAKTLSRYLDGIMIRTFSHESVVELAENASIPVINGLTDYLHPCQILADLFTIKEKKGILKGLKMTYIGDGNNVANSLLTGCAMVGMDIAVVTPPGYEPVQSVVDQAKSIAIESGSKIYIETDLQNVIEGSDIVYTDVWTSMGQEKETQERLKLFQGYQMNSEVLQKAKKDVLVMHCLPAHRGEEITSEVLDGPNSVVFDQAENRMHAQKGLLAALL
ncbi:MAG: ornithine carbamoyltransferase [Desulfitibacter sp. BRH_c19]|nr:MAG: ornithine carbamoyltransferase [Desulfitibacter sp. BRH_c19]